MIQHLKLVGLLALASAMIGCASIGVLHSPEVIEPGESEIGFGLNDVVMGTWYMDFRFGIFPRVDSCIRLISNFEILAGRIDVGVALVENPTLLTMIGSAGAGISISMASPGIRPWYELSGTLLAGSRKFYGGLQVLYLSSEVLNIQWGGGPLYAGVILGGAIGNARTRLHPEVGVFGPIVGGEGVFMHLGCGITISFPAKTATEGR